MDYKKIVFHLKNGVKLICPKGKFKETESRTNNRIHKGVIDVEKKIIIDEGNIFIEFLASDIKKIKYKK